MAVGYNQDHVQVAPTGASPTWLDVPGLVAWEPAVTADSNDINGDGGIYATVYSAPTGEGDLTFNDLRLPVIAVVNGGTVSSTGTAPNTIEKWSMPGTYVPSPFQIADWVPNADPGHDSAVAGVRTTVLNATAGLVSRAGGQENELTYTVPTKFTRDANGNMMSFEKMQSAPVFTAGVFPLP